MGLKDWIDTRFPSAASPDARGWGGLRRFSNNVRDSANLFMFGRASSGQRVDERTSMQITTVYACVRLLAESMASMPLHLYRYEEPDGSNMPRRAHYRAFDHPLYRILYQQPNKEMSKFSFIEVMMTHLLLWGNAYSFIERNQKGEVLSLYPLLPELVEVDRVNNDLVYTYHAFTDEHPGPNGKDIYYRRDEILHIPGLSFNGLIGFSPIAMQKNALGGVLAVDAYGSEYFRNGGRLSGVITLDHPVKDFDRLRNSWKLAYGDGQMHGTAILEEGAKYQSISLPPEDSQFLSSRKFGVEEICRIFRVPPHLVQYLDKASYASIEEQGIDFATYTLGPWAERIQEAISKDVLIGPERDRYYAKFNLNSLQRGNYANRMSGYATGRSNGWFSMNDIRELEDLNPVPADKGGEDILINGSYVRVEDAGLAYGKNAMAEREKEASSSGSGTGPDEDGNGEEAEGLSRGASQRKAERKQERRGR